MDIAQETILHFALEKFDAMTAILAEMDDATANRTLGVPGSNTPYVIVFHSLGAMRRWSSTVNRGIEIPRDRRASSRRPVRWQTCWSWPPVSAPRSSRMSWPPT